MDEDKLESPEFYVTRIGDCCRMMCSPLFENDRNSGGTPSSEFNMCAAHLCYCCECALCHGLKETTGSFFYAGKPRLIDVLGAVPNSMPKTERAAGAIMLNEAKMRAKTATGKARALIRELLNKGAFTEWLSTLNMSTALLARYYEPGALVANYDHVEKIGRQLDELTKLVYLSYSLTDPELGADNYWALHPEVTCYVPRSELASVTIMSLLSDDNPQLLQVQAILDAQFRSRWFHVAVPRATIAAEALVRAAATHNIRVLTRHAVLTCALLRAHLSQPLTGGSDGGRGGLPVLKHASSVCAALLRAHTAQIRWREDLIPAAVHAEALTRTAAVTSLQSLRCAASAAQGLILGSAQHRRHAAETTQGLIRARILSYGLTVKAAQGLLRTSLLAHERSAAAAQGLLRTKRAPDVPRAFASVHGMLAAVGAKRRLDKYTEASCTANTLIVAGAAEARYRGVVAAAQNAQALLALAAEEARRLVDVADGVLPAQAAVRAQNARRTFCTAMCAACGAQSLVRCKLARAVFSVPAAASAARDAQAMLTQKACMAKYTVEIAARHSQGLLATATHFGKYKADISARHAQGLLSAAVQFRWYTMEVAVRESQYLLSVVVQFIRFHSSVAASAAQSLIRQKSGARSYAQEKASLWAQSLVRGAHTSVAYTERCSQSEVAQGMVLAAVEGKKFANKRAAASVAASLRKCSKTEGKFSLTVGRATVPCQALIRARRLGEAQLDALAAACVMIQGYIRDGIAEHRKEEEKKRRLLDLERKTASAQKSLPVTKESFGGKTVAIVDDYSVANGSARLDDPIFDAPSKKPVWVPDDSSEFCCLCRTPFTFFNRKVGSLCLYNRCVFIIIYYLLFIVFMCMCFLASLQKLWKSCVCQVYSVYEIT